MKIKIAMPEILVLFSLLMYPQSFTFSIVAFVLGLTGRIFSYVMDFHEKQTQAQSVKEGVDEMAEALKGIFKSD